MADRDTLPGEDESLWLATTDRTDFPALDRDRHVDTAVVGGGIAGVTAALHAAEAGQSVVLLERDRIVEGVTGKTTAKVTAQHGLIYDDLLDKHGRDAARQYARANAAAIEEVAERVERHDIDCGFERLPAYTYAADREQRGAVGREATVAEGLDLPAEFVADPPFPDESPGAVKFADQAQFHPRQYLLDLADEIPREDAHVFEGTKVTDVDDGGKGDPCRVETEGGTVTAESVLLTTHFPIVDPAFYFARQYPKRSYVLAVELAEEPPRGMFYRDQSPYFSARPVPSSAEWNADGPVMLVGGQNHKTGQGGSTAERYRKLERQARDHFDVAEVRYRWSTQDYVSIDRIPFVGELGPTTHGVYVATGFAGWGMTNGTAAGKMLAAYARGETPRWADAFDPQRFDPEAGGKEFLKENLDVGTEFTRDWAKAPFRGEDPAVAPGEGEVVRRGGKQLAVARDEDGELHVSSAVCTHMDCIVHWNDAEQSWDCPCHGSRFGLDGEVLDGPAVEDLPTRGE
ncbi:FAD-dependent oxidoreductase [Halorussus gelatinilyticus]|uniref:FAD-dependent oxidoreductase n=1 Tax=Halorussus gelatinilyticus TaxID=2937524 RepID=A0A8U0IEB3_9EURY|nr:FAD-dependent oxidoreductase [Halorussus gelatinilyticus]UPV99409.1 FAD-dependent oxidoreductase [Halorussus gelatinilyticus]